jgi:exodeoxyribonuclease-3
VLSVSTANVNGVRAAARKGFLGWLAASRADVICLQEVRAEVSELPAELATPEGWHVAAAPAETPGHKGRNGVITLTRAETSAVRVGFGAAEFDTGGRYLEVDLPGLTVANLYLPNGEVGTARQEAKERFMAAFLPYLAELRAAAAAAGKDVLVCGDWNIAHREADLKNWRNNQRNSGFLPGERAWMDRVFGEAGYVDVVRSLHPDQAGPYSWWSYRGKAFDNDAGWRIDYVAATPGIAGAASSAAVERAASYDTRWSDHAPVTVTFDTPGIPGCPASAQPAE